MGLIQSVFCSVLFCAERVLTWTCCAFVLMLLMFILIILMVYGISVGYHYAQKELASFAMSARSTTEATIGDQTPQQSRRRGADAVPVVRMVAVNKSEAEGVPQPYLEIQQTRKPSVIYLENSETPVVVLETERPPKKPELSPQERELARRLISRYRRSKNITMTAVPFLRPLNSTEPPFRARG